MLTTLVKNESSTNKLKVIVIDTGLELNVANRVLLPGESFEFTHHENQEIKTEEIKTEEVKDESAS